MFRHKTCHPQGACFVILPNYISTIAANYCCFIFYNKAQFNGKFIFLDDLFLKPTLRGGDVTEKYYCCTELLYCC